MDYRPLLNENDLRTYVNQQVALKCSEEIKCGNCPDIKKPLDMYRCLYCGIYYCLDCAEDHFGQTIDDWYKQKHN